MGKVADGLNESRCGSHLSFVYMYGQCSHVPERWVSAGLRSHAEADADCVLPVFAIVCSVATLDRAPRAGPTASHLVGVLGHRPARPGGFLLCVADRLNESRWGSQLSLEYVSEGEQPVSAQSCEVQCRHAIFICDMDGTCVIRNTLCSTLRFVPQSDLKHEAIRSTLSKDEAGNRIPTTWRTVLSTHNTYREQVKLVRVHHCANMLLVSQDM